MRWLCVLLLSTLASAAHAAEIISVSVERESGTYHMVSEVRFNAGLEHLYDVFSNWDLSTQFSSVVVESRNLPPDASGRLGFFARNQLCVLFFCKSVERTGYVESQPYEMIRAVADPASSDFHVSEETWLFERDGEHTIVSYELRMRPKFWVPPVIGPYVIKRKLRSGGIDALARIESIANAQALANE